VSEERLSLSNLKPAQSRRDRKRVGRGQGSGKGRYSGRGKDAMPIGPFRTTTYAVNVRDLEAKFDAGAEVTVEALAAAGLVKSSRGDVKILGQGDLTKKLSVAAHNFSKSAREKIEKAGGTVTWLRGEPVAKKPAPAKQRPVAEEAPAEEARAAEAPVEEEEAES
jgi:large subunit ribosomal protein L15